MSRWVTISHTWAYKCPGGPESILIVQRECKLSQVGLETCPCLPKPILLMMMMMASSTAFTNYSYVKTLASYDVEASLLPHTLTEYEKKCFDAISLRRVSRSVSTRQTAPAQELLRKRSIAPLSHSVVL